MTKPDFKRILIIATRQIGDVLCTTPLMRRTREIWPDAVIDVLGYEKTMGMLSGNTDINEVIESPEHPKWPEYKRLIKRIFRKYDLAIVTQPSDRAHIYGLLAASMRVGIVPQAKAHNWWKRLLCLHTVQLDYWTQHVVVERLRLLAPFEPKAPQSIPRTTSLVPPRQATLPPQIQEFVSGKSFVVFHATPMWRFKRWPVANWAALAKEFVQAGRSVILSGSGSDQDRELNLSIFQALSVADIQQHVFDASGLLDFNQLAALLAKANLYVGVDTSVTHLAAAIGVPTVALFGATSPPNFGPWPQSGTFEPSEQSIWQLRGELDAWGARHQEIRNVALIQGPGSCVPCRKAGCLDKFESHSDCLDQLSVNSVMKVCTV